VDSQLASVVERLSQRKCLPHKIISLGLKSIISTDALYDPHLIVVNTSSRFNADSLKNPRHQHQHCTTTEWRIFSSSLTTTKTHPILPGPSSTCAPWHCHHRTVGPVRRAGENGTGTYYRSAHSNWFQHTLNNQELERNPVQLPPPNTSV